MPECSLRELPPMMVATLAMHGPYAQMPKAFGVLYGRLAQEGHVPEGMPHGIYLTNPSEVPEDQAVWEVWTRIEDEAAPAGPDADGYAVRAVPATTVAATVHRGPYEQVAPAYAALGAWIAGQGLEMSGPPMEAYLNDPSGLPSEEYLTEVLFPVRRP